MRTGPSPKTVFVCISSERASERLARAVGVVGAVPKQISFAELRSGHRGALEHLVYDLSPWTPTAAATLTGILETNPTVRALLYVPVRADGLDMLPRFGGLDGVCTKVQSFSVATFGLLCGLLRFVCSGDTASIGEGTVTAAVPNLTPTMWNMLRVATANITSARASGSLRVVDLARELNISPRTLTRKFTGAGLPPPKEFLDWMLLMYVADRASREGCPAFVMARRLGCDANAFYRVKKRRLGQAASADRYSFDLVRDLFLDRCRALGDAAATPMAENRSVGDDLPIRRFYRQDPLQPEPDDRRVRIVTQSIQNP